MTDFTKLLHPIALFLAIALALPVSGTADAHAGLNPLKSRLNAVKHVARIVKKSAKFRHKCANAIERGKIDWSVDCSQDPVAFGGAGTGDPKTDDKLTKSLGRGLGRYLRLRNDGSLPSDHGLEHACGGTTENWSEIDSCLFQLANDTSKELLATTFHPVERSLDRIERRCRLKLGRAVRNLYAKLVRHRAKCFARNGLLGDGRFADRYECLSPAGPPGLGSPRTGLDRTDNAIGKSFNRVRTTVYRSCPDDLERISFPGSLPDTTGGAFGRADLVQVILDKGVEELEPLLAGIYAGEERCGDGVLQVELGEECDDGNRDSCDGCDRNCTLPVCGNAVGCAGDGEECDDGDDDEGDGCTPTCVREFCGDGLVQPGLGEDCDDRNTDDGDGCDATCDFEL